MELSDLTKSDLQSIIDLLEDCEVEAKKPTKPTKDELLDALEDFEENNPGKIAEVVEGLGLFEEDDSDDEPDEANDDADDLDEDEGENSEPETGKPEPKKKQVKDNIYTYVGAGETSPHRINFMGRQQFVKGRPQEVTDPIILSKIDGCPTFVKGEADAELIQDIEDEGAAVAEKNRRIDQQMDENFKKQHGGSEKE